MLKFLTAAIVAASLAVPGAASASITRTGPHSYSAVPAACSCVVAVDGYVFTGLPYYNGSPEVDSAVELWWALLADPGYASAPAVTSVSVDSTVSGEVIEP